MRLTAQTRFRAYFQRRTHIRSLIIRSNSFTPSPEQLSLFPPQGLEAASADLRPHQTDSTRAYRDTRLFMKIIQWGRSHMDNYKDKIGNIYKAFSIFMRQN